MQKTLKNLDVNVGNVIAGSEMEIKKAKQKIANKKWYLKNKERQSKRKKLWYLKNKKHCNKKNKSWYLKNKEKKLEKNKLWYLKNKEYHNQNNKQYFKENREKIRNRNKKRRHVNIEYRLTINLRRRFLLALQGKNKSNSTIKLLGCTPEFLKKYIESKFKPGMSWDKRHLFHIDHIRPCASFDLSKPEEQEKCFHYTNLQPLWAKDNLSKGAKYDG
jgi:hypothetical protein